MTQFKGFKTMVDAKKFIKENRRGVLLYDKLTPTGRKTTVAKDYEICVRAGGLNSVKYPFCVEWNV